MLVAATSQGQNSANNRANLDVKKANAEIKIDGRIDEDDWLEAQVASNFVNQWPSDSGAAEAITEVRLTYDENFIYIGAILYDDGENRIIQSLRRDNDSHWNSDGFTVIFDPINNKSNGFVFGVNAGGAQMEGTANSQGNETNVDLNWDNKWMSEIGQYENMWVVEMAIPFKTLRYNSSSTSWGINFVRNDMKRNIYSTWSAVPRNLPALDIGYTGQLQWDAAPQPSKGKVILIPYASGNIARNHEDNESTKYDGDVGLDAKIAVTSSLNLDLTVNPDFSNVDVDQQVTNLSRFSIFFPEKRNFFLENSDLFSNFGTWNLRPFFSRKIGLNDGEAIPILYGARLSGNLTDDLRIGALDVQTRATDEFKAQNYAVAAFQQRVLKRSTVKGIFVNRQSSDKGEGFNKTDYNRVGGLEFQYLNESGRFGGSLRYHTSFTPEDTDDNSYYGANVEYNSRNFFTGLNLDKVGQNYVTDVGFAPRLNNTDSERDTTVRIGYTFINPWVGANFFTPESKVLNFHGPRTWHIFNINDDGELTERRYNLFYVLGFRNTSFFRIRFSDSQVTLPFALDLIGGDDFLPAGKYIFREVWAGYESDSRRTISFNSEITYGSFYNGTKLTLSGGLNIRQQPWGNFGINYTQNRVDLPENFGNTTLHLIGPQAEVSFSNKMFWTSFLQFNTQAENFNINSRFQWRYRPMSDLFIVYSDNYATDNLNVKNRGVVVKITYWLNL